MFKLKSLQKNKVFKHGVPMLVMVVGGALGLREFNQIRYDAKNMKQFVPPLVPTSDDEKPRDVLQEEYEKMKGKDFQDWQNIRGPRPWEDSRQYQEDQRSRPKNTLE